MSAVATSDWLTIFYFWAKIAQAFKLEDDMTREKQGELDGFIKDWVKRQKIAKAGQRLVISVQLGIEGEGNPQGELPNGSLSKESAELRKLVEIWCSEKNVAGHGRRSSVTVSVKVEDVDVTPVISLRGVHVNTWASIFANLSPEHRFYTFLKIFENKEDVAVSVRSLEGDAANNYESRMSDLNHLFSSGELGRAVKHWRFGYARGKITLLTTGK